MKVPNSLNTVCTYTGTQTHHFENRFRTNIYPYTWRHISSELIHSNMNLYMTTYLFRTYTFEYELIHDDVSIQNLYIWIWTYTWRRISLELIHLNMNLYMTTYILRTLEHIFFKHSVVLYPPQRPMTSDLVWFPFQIVSIT